MRSHVGLITIVAVVTVIVIWVASLIFVPRYYEGPAEAGQFGDMFGGANATFSGLAFAGAMIAILMQRNELKLQREQLEFQRKELELTREELSKSAEALQGQLDVSIDVARLNAATALMTSSLSIVLGAQRADAATWAEGRSEMSKAEFDAWKKEVSQLFFDMTKIE